MRLNLRKSQHLCGESTISYLYRNGKAFLSFPIRVVYLVSPRDDNNRPTVRVMFAAPKKYFKHAVDRNRYKRLLREAYRLQQEQLNEYLDKNNLVMDMSLSAVHNKLPDFEVIKEKIDKVIQNIISHM